MILCCILTVILESAVFLIAGYGKKHLFMPLCIAVNVMTNLALNGFSREYNLLICEAVIICVEYIIYATAVGRSVKLFGLTAAANVFSCMVGIALLWR